MRNAVRGLILASLFALFFVSSMAVAQDAQTEVKFDRAYWLAQAPEVRALESMDRSSVETRQAVRDKALELAKQGFTIDAPIMVWGWGPYNTMLLRKSYGFTWVPSALQPNVPVAPGIEFPGLAKYDPDHPPVGSIKVSVSIEDYPPFDKPAPAPVVNMAASVGALSFGCVYFSPAGDTAKDGEKVSDIRGTFTKHLVPSPFGSSAWYTLDGCK